VNRLRCFLHFRRLTQAEVSDPEPFLRRLGQALSASGFQPQSPVQEDWGWWLEFSDYPVKIALCIYFGEQGESALTTNLSQDRQWSWRAFKMHDTGSMANTVYDHVERILGDDPAIEIVGWVEEFPF